MRLSQVAIKRFKSIKELSLTIPARDERRQGSADFVSIVGENNVGKSSILEAIRLACPGSSKPTIDQFRNLDPSIGPIEVELEFDKLTEADKEKHAVRAHLFTDGGIEKYRIKKVWRAPGVAPESFAYSPNDRQYRFREWPELKSKAEFANLGPEWNAIVDAADAAGAKKLSRPSKDSYLRAAVQLNSPLIEETEPWSPNPGGNLSNLDSVLPTVIWVPALRETGAEANVSEKQSAVRKIVNALFEQQLSKHERVIRFRRAAEELEQLFASDGKHKIVASVESQITSKLKELIDICADLRFIAPDVTSDLASKTEFRVLDGNISTRPEHQGHGAQRSIVLALLQMWAEQLRVIGSSDASRTLFLIEEPEIYLHPEMCRRMRDALLRISQSGVGQVICTTHSPVFLDLADRHDGIVIVKKGIGSPATIQLARDIFGQDEGNKERRSRLRMILNFDSAANEVFFTSKVTLVEGDCEIAAIDAIARRLCHIGEIHWPTYLAARRSVAVINCRGKWTIPAFQIILNEFGIKYRVVHDEDDTDEATRANDQIGALLPLQDCRLVHRPNFEKQMFGKSWTRDKPWKATVAIESTEVIDQPLREFFEHVLHEKIERLCPTKDDVAVGNLATTALQQAPKRNLRNQLRKLNVPDHVIQAAHRVEQIFRLPAGPNFSPDISEAAQLFRIEGSRASAFAIVTGDSMEDTLASGDVVALDFLDSVYLEPVNDNKDKITKDSFCSRVKHDEIYVIAINDDIELRAYTIKRVRVHELVSGGWLCQISADNPENPWGERGHVEIRRTDRVHFAARVVGIVTASEAAEKRETVIVPSTHE
ncbi:AAA family ATPase [Sorangium sp. So ce1504]|uniref:AAA family ATPase n=1 Tax=Sorangium sp. So ce1504 TaxID=3133337 RepID=UPI003F63D616